MSGTAPHRELPAVGMVIAALHGSGQWYYGPLEVVDSDESTRVVEVHPTHWKDQNRTIVYTPSAANLNPCQWALVSELTDDEREGLNIPIAHPDP